MARKIRIGCVHDKYFLFLDRFPHIRENMYIIRRRVQNSGISPKFAGSARTVKAVPIDRAHVTVSRGDF